jgi:hypothetical protein
MGSRLGKSQELTVILCTGSVTAGPHLCLDSCTQSVNTDDTNIIIARDRRHVPHHLLVPGVPLKMHSFCQQKQQGPAVFRDVKTRSPASNNTYPYDTGSTKLRNVH